MGSPELDLEETKAVNSQTNKQTKLAGGRSDLTQPSLHLNFKVNRSFPGKEERAKCSARHPG